MGKKMGENVVEERRINLEDIVFFSKKRVTRNDDCDVYVSIGKHAETKTGKKRHIRFSFRDTISNIFEGYKYISFGLVENRIYFKPETQPTYGFKLQKTDFVKAIMCSITDDEAEVFKPFSNKTYHIKHDDYLDMYYIELPEQDY